MHLEEVFPLHCCGVLKTMKTYFEEWKKIHVKFGEISNWCGIAVHAC